MNKRSDRPRLKALAAFVAGTLLVTACGSSDSSSDATTTATTASGAGASATTGASPGATVSGSTVASPTTTAVSSDPLGTPNKATGTPIKIGWIGDGQSATIDQSDVDLAAEAAFEYANDYLGGIGGHPVELTICDTKADVAIATDCANQFVTDDVAAVVLYTTGQLAPIAKVVQDAKIPLFVGAGTDGATDSESSFYLSNGLSSFLHPAAVARDNTFTSAAMLVIDVPSASGSAKALGSAMMAKAGVTQVDVVAVAPGTADMSPQVQAIMSKNPQMVHVLGNAAFCLAALTALQAADYKGVITVISACIDDNTINGVGSFLKGVTVGYPFTIDKEDPDVQLWTKIIDTYGDPDKTPFRASTVFSVATVLNLARVFTGYTGELTHPALIAGAKATKDVPLAFGAGLTMTCDGTAVPVLPAVCTAGVLQSALDDEGQPTTFSKVDAGTLLAIG